MKYRRPRTPEKEIELCLDLFDKKEAKKRILKYIEGVFDDAESQLKIFSISHVSQQSERLKAFIRWNNQHNGIASPVPEGMADRYLESL